MPKIDIDAAPTLNGTGYPDEFAAPCKPRRRQRLGDAVGLDQFGVNLLRLPAGAWSSQRHWHAAEDEFVWVLDGEVVLVRALNSLQGAFYVELAEKRQKDEAFVYGWLLNRVA